MKKVIDVNIGRTSFAIEDDAYISLKSYLTDFESSLGNDEDTNEIMEDIEMRVAELFQKNIKYPNQVVDTRAVNYVIECLGRVESNNSQANSTEYGSQKNNDRMEKNKKLYRNPDDKKMFGVCSGIAIYLNIDVTIVRVIFATFTILGFGSAIVAYFILWLVMPEAKTAAQKLEMRGEPVTAESIRNYTNTSSKN